MKKRSYKQSCALALASDLLGERWTLLIFRELLIQPCRFKQLNQWLEGMGTNLLTHRLKELETAQLIEKQSAGDKRSAYQLTQLGKTVEPLVLEFVRWGFHHLSAERGFQHYPHWDLLAMKALFHSYCGEDEIVLQFLTNEFEGWACVTPSGFKFGLGPHIKPHQTIETDIATFQHDWLSGKYTENKEIKQFINCFSNNLTA